MELVFWLAIGTVAYAYIGYPAVLTLLSWLASPPRRSLRWCPRLSVIIAAHNEARWIEAKLASTLGQHYPADRLEAIVISDGSTDGTDEIVLQYPDPRVRLIRQEPRAGKSAALNRGVAAATGEVLVFTDANALFAPDALARLAALFNHDRVGLVSGQGLYGAAAAGDGRAVGNGYVRYEALTREGESALGFLAGADGAIYALRRTLYRPLHPAEVNDLLHPIQTALAGGVCRFDPQAYTLEPPSKDGGQEFRRHVRIIAQGMALLRQWLPRLMAARCGRAVWALVSHRVLRWASAPCLVTAFAANLTLLGSSTLYDITLAGQLGFYSLALIGAAADRAGTALGKLAIPYYFCVVSAAGVAGYLRWVRGGAEAVWAPARPAAAQDRAT